MATVAALTELYGNFMLGPRPGAGVCGLCGDLIDPGAAQRCHRCRRDGAWLDAAMPISYSVAHEQLHHCLAAYKRIPETVARRFQVELAAVLWRALEGHERCLARAAGTPAFDVVTAVPSGSPERDVDHPLHRMLGDLVEPVRGRYARLLARTAKATQPRRFDPEKYRTGGDLSGARVLLIDDTWTTGASVFSAAAALKDAGAHTVAALVIGRHLHRDWADNARRLESLARPFDWTTCLRDPGHGLGDGPPPGGTLPASAAPR